MDILPFDYWLIGIVVFVAGFVIGSIVMFLWYDAHATKIFDHNEAEIERVLKLYQHEIDILKAELENKE